MFLSEQCEFPSAPCLAGKILITARVSMLLKSRASLTCFRACFFLVGLRTYQHPGTKFCLPFRDEIFRYLGVFSPTSSLCPVFSKDHLRCHSVSFLNNLFYGMSPIRHYWLRNQASSSTRKHVLLQNDLFFVALQSENVSVSSRRQKSVQSHCTSHHHQ